MGFNRRHPVRASAIPGPASADQDTLRVADLAFEHQILVWALRIMLEDHAGAASVQRMLYRALPPAAARIAFESIETVLASLRRHGTRPLAFKSLETDAVARDEFLLLTVYCALGEEPRETARTRACWLIGAAGCDALLAALASLSAALSTRKAARARMAAPAGDCAVLH